MKSLLIVICLSFMFTVHAKIVARVSGVEGNAFIFNDGESYMLKYGSKVEDMSEVVVEDGSALTLLNSQGHEFHVNGGSLVKFNNGITELKNGSIWVINEGFKKGFVHSANSIANYGLGQFIYSFDNMTGKTQLLVITGDIQFSNTLEPNLHVSIPSGYFSLVDPKLRDGLPRAPTKVGLKSYKKIKSTFAHFKQLQKIKIDRLWEAPKKVNRSIASVNDQFSLTTVKKVTNKKRGKLIIIKTYSGRIPASISQSSSAASPMDYLQNKVKENKKAYIPVKTGSSAKIRYFGFDNKKSSPEANTGRTPASVKKLAIIKDLKGPVSVFSKTFTKKQNSNQRHSDDVNSLIDELESYKADYQKKY